MKKTDDLTSSDNFIQTARLLNDWYEKSLPFTTTVTCFLAGTLAALYWIWELAAIASEHDPTLMTQLNHCFMSLGVVPLILLHTVCRSLRYGANPSLRLLASGVALWWMTMLCTAIFGCFASPQLEEAISFLSTTVRFGVGAITFTVLLIWAQNPFPSDNRPPPDSFTNRSGE